MQKQNNYRALWLLFILCSGAAQAQKAGETLQQAIEIARVNKANELGLRADVRAEGMPLQTETKTSRSAAAPKVWSISGVGRDLVAEVVYEGKVHHLSLFQNELYVGPWMLTRLSDTSAEFVSHTKNQRMTANSQVVTGVTPSSLANMQSYFEAPVSLSGLGTSAALGANAPGARMPLPPELMRSALQP